jgi:polyisoprenoid-binding protein YceI
MKRPSTLCALLGTVGLSVAPLAFPSETPSRQLSPAPSSANVVELRKQSGRVEFFAVGWPSALKIHGQGPGAEGVVHVTSGTLSGSLAFDLDSLETGIGLRDRHMKEKYLHTARYPRAELTLSALDVSKVPDSGDFAPVTIPFQGTLSLHGVERPVSGSARLSRSGERVSATAEFPLELGDFGIEVPSYLGITVAEKVQVKTTFTARVELRDAAGR